MTNNEILHAHLLDIIFDKRNKDYGAYALRREYNHRLLISIGFGMSLVLLFALISILKKEDSFSPVIENKPEFVLRTYELQRQKIKEPEVVREQPKPKPVEQVATKRITSQINIKPDQLVKSTFPPVNVMDNFKPSDMDRDGKKPGFIPQSEPVLPGNGNKTIPVIETNPKEGFRPDEKNPRFPGGPEALQEFFARNLVAPDELEAGDKKTVQIRFKVDKDGTINSFEILTSGGPEFDREVIRVCRKMPRWEPASQNGVYVSVSYMLPVTFIGNEQ